MERPDHSYHTAFLTLILTLITVFSCIPGFSQSRENYFSSTGEVEYFDKLESIFKISPEKKRAKEFLEQFEEFWYSPSTSDEIKKSIISISDLLYKKQARAFPDYYLFLSTIQAFVDSGAPNQNFSIWKDAAITFLNQPRYYVRHFNELLKTTKGIIEERKLYGASGVAWYSRNTEYAFKFKGAFIKLFSEEYRRSIKKH